MHTKSHKMQNAQNLQQAVRYSSHGHKRSSTNSLVLSKERDAAKEQANIALACSLFSRHRSTVTGRDRITLKITFGTCIFFRFKISTEIE